jgi:hypothetical protein
MVEIIPTHDAARTARLALCRRIRVAAARRFVANAQRALPRDGTARRHRERKLVARFARHARHARKRPMRLNINEPAAETSRARAGATHRALPLVIAEID